VREVEGDTRDDVALSHEEREEEEIHAGTLIRMY
jgi:hypothetical protein